MFYPGMHLKSPLSQNILTLLYKTNKYFRIDILSFDITQNTHTKKNKLS